MRTHGRGYTLIELLTAIAVLALLASAAPPLTKLLNETRQYSQLAEMQRLIETARSTAVSTGHNITLCGSSDIIGCSKNWNSTAVLIFDDHNGNHQLDSREQVIYRSQMPQGRWHWRGSNKPYLRFRPDGTSIEWGHFTLCPMSKEISYASQIILNFVGRPYIKKIPTGNLEASDSCN